MGGTVYLDRKDAELRLDGGALAVYVRGERAGLVPLAPVDRLVLVGNQTVQTSVLHRLAAQGIAVLFLSGRTQAYRGRLVGRLHNHARLRLRQYAESRGPLALELATSWIAAKLAGQAALLRNAAAARPEKRALLLRAAEIIGATRDKVAQAGTIECLRGLEGGAASAYFSALPALFPSSLGFAGRERRPPRDPVNALLSLTYTLAHWEWVRECEVIGLDPLVGFYHEVEYGRESLACDLLEPFRPVVDRWVWELFSTRQFEGRDFTVDDDRPGCALKKSARGRYYAAYEAWITPYRASMRETVEALARRLLGRTDGQDALFESTSGAASQP
jgi:CRISPR-associated protein Cas1